MYSNLNSTTIRFSRILSNIPLNVWTDINKKEPEWIHMEKYLSKYGFGPFATLMVVSGLNDYQLKRRSEIGYWPIIDQHLEHAPIPTSPDELENNLIPFFSNERFSENKMMRIHKFLHSSLAAEIWNSQPNDINGEFDEIWIELAEVMNQYREMKTIVFAMKCLGLSLLMTGIDTVPFQYIPIPVDSRIKELTRKINPDLKNDGEIQRVWRNILKNIRLDNPGVTMIHLDSLAWQIGRMKRTQVISYFSDLGLQKIGMEISEII